MPRQDKIVSIQLDNPLPARTEYPILAKLVSRNKGRAVISYAGLKDDPLSEDEKKAYYRMIADHITLKVGKSIEVDFGAFHICLHRATKDIWTACCHWHKTEEAKIDCPSQT